MKLPRYTSTALPQLATLDPATAAASAAAPFQVVSDVANTVGQVIEVNRAISDAQDVADFETAGVNAKLTNKEILASEDWRKPSVNGEPTALAMQKRFDANRIDSLNKLSDIKNPKLREKARVRLDQYFRDAAIDFGSKIDTHKINEARAQSAVSFQTALSIGEFDDAAEIAHLDRDTGLISADQLAGALAQVSAARFEARTDDLAAPVNEGFSVSRQAGEDAYAAVVEKEYASEDEREKTIDKAEEMRGEWLKLYDTAEAKADLASHRDYANYRLVAQEGAMTMDTPDRLLSSGALGTGTKGVERRNQLLFDVYGAQKDAYSQDVIAGQIEDGIPLYDTPENRKGLDQYFKTILQGSDPEEYYNVVSQVTAAASMVPPSVQLQIETLSRSPESLADAVLLHQATLVPGSFPSTAAVPDVVADAAALIEDNVPIAAATKLAWENRTATDEERGVWQRDWDTDEKGIDTMNENFVSLFDGRQIFEGTDADEINPLMRASYDGTYQRVYSVTGNYKAAQQQASDAIAREWRRTKMNGDWEIMQYGLPGDVEEFGDTIRAKIIADNKNFFTPEGVPVKSKDIRLQMTNQVQYKTMPPLEEPVPHVVVKAFIGATPLMTKGERGLMPVAIGLTADEMQSEVVLGSQRADLEKRLSQIETDRQRLTRSRAQSAARVGVETSGQAAQFETELQGLEKAAERTRTDLEELNQSLPSFEGQQSIGPSNTAEAPEL